MLGLPDNLEDKHSPRKSAEALYYMHEDTLLVHSKYPVTLPKDLVTEVDMTPVPPVIEGAPYLLQSQVSRLYRPRILLDESVRQVLTRSGQKPHATAKKVPVPSERLVEWTRTKLRREGVSFDDSTLTALPGHDLVLDKRHPSHRNPTANITVHVTGTPDLEKLVNSGLGSAKNFGAGLVRLTPLI